MDLNQLQRRQKYLDELMGEVEKIDDDILREIAARLYNVKIFIENYASSNEENVGYKKNLRNIAIPKLLESTLQLANLIRVNAGDIYEKELENKIKDYDSY